MKPEPDITGGEGEMIRGFHYGDTTLPMAPELTLWFGGSEQGSSMVSFLIRLKAITGMFANLSNQP